MTPFRRSATLSAKLGTLGALLMAVALGSIALTLWVTWQLEGGAAAVNEAGRLRMQTWRLAQAAGSGDAERLAQLTAQFDASIALLTTGDPARPLLVPGDDDTAAAFATVRSNWGALRGTWLAQGGDQPARAAQRAEALVADVDAFVTGIESRLSSWTALLTMFQLTLMGLAIAAGVALLYAAHLFVFRPLSQLQQGLAAVEAGDLSSRVEVSSQDEFGAVAQGFNRMAGRLEESVRGLEHRVQRKTETLRAERERLAVLYDASRFVASADTLQALADGFARRARSVGRADGALLRWNDGGRSQMVLMAAEGVPEAMLEQERCLTHGSCHCGPAAGVTGARVIAIQPAGAAGEAGLRACQRHGFQTVATVPVRLQDQVLGEVDLLYRSAAVTLTPEDRALLESLASLLASGMESVRVSALEREAAVSEERSLIARELHDSIAQALAFMKIQIQLLRGALKRGDAGRTETVVQELDTGVRESMADVRELLLHFRTRASSEDIVPAIRTTLAKFEHQTGLATHLEVKGHALPLAPDVQVQLLHVVQEALSNVRKHAQATQVWLTVQQHPAWRIEVRDDGQGFAAEGPGPDETHVGLRIMRERAAGIGALVELQSAPGQGTRVAVVLPERQPQPRAVPFEEAA